ncbi:glycoside hydrolase family 3 protein [bacterium]|jgi:beta-N-acetylhexosaminidase|nr:glycoside hydrolase family 3 protein [bacterium]
MKIKSILLCFFLWAVILFQPSFSITLNQKIGQLLMVGFIGQYPSEPSIQLLQTHILKGELGGVLLFKHNIVSKQQTTDLLTALKNTPSDLPLFIAVDQEGGYVQRLTEQKGFTKAPSPRIVATSYSDEETTHLYDTMAEELAETGFNLNLGAMADLNLYPKSPVIGKLNRSYSANPYVARKNAGLMIDAHRIHKVICAIKHYPGYGSARIDPHTDALDSSLFWSVIELLPFRWLIKDKRADMIMSAHIMIDHIDRRHPASMSVIHLRQNLRGKEHFKGVVISDDLMMGAIQKTYGFKESIIRAIQAGNDVLIYGNTHKRSGDLPQRFQAIVREAIKQGRLSETQIETAYRRILKLKKAYL